MCQDIIWPYDNKKKERKHLFGQEIDEKVKQAEFYVGQQLLFVELEKKHKELQDFSKGLVEYIMECSPKDFHSTFIREVSIS